MTERLIFFVSGLSWKVFAGLFTSCSLFFGVVLGEMTTNHLGMAGIAGAIATALAGILLVVPRVMEQRRKSRESNAKLQAELLTRLTSIHERSENFYKERLAALELVVALHVKSKHDAIGEWSSMKDGYLILSGQLRALGHTPEIILHPKSYQEIIGESDKEIKALAAARVAESPPPYPPSPIEP